METLTNFWNQVCEIWNECNTFYQVSFIVLIAFWSTGIILLCEKSDDESKSYKYEKLSSLSFMAGFIAIINMIVYALWYILVDDHSFIAWSIIIVVSIILIHGYLLEIRDYMKNKNLIEKHQIWVNSLEAIQSLLKDRLSALGNVEQFEFYFPQENERYDDGLISYIDGIDVLSIVRKTLKKIPPKSKVVIADERIYILPKDNGDTRIRNMEKELFKDMLVDLSKIRYSIVFKKGEDHYVVSR